MEEIIWKTGRCRWENNIKMDLQQVGWEGMDYIDLARDWDRWRALVNAVMNLWVSYDVGTFWLTEDLLASQKGLCCM